MTILDRYTAQGFDETYIVRDRDDYGQYCRPVIRPKCSQCETLVINGMACHETGCSHIVRERDDDGEDFE